MSAALGALLERHRAGLYATALGVLGDPSEAHDAVQDTFLDALARLQELREPAAVAGWLRVVVRNNCLMRVRPAAKSRPPTSRHALLATPTALRPSTGSPWPTGCGRRSTGSQKTRPPQ